jgi:hypothetical protein
MGLKIKHMVFLKQNEKFPRNGKPRVVDIDRNTNANSFLSLNQPCQERDESKCLSNYATLPSTSSGT